MFKYNSNSLISIFRHVAHIEDTSCNDRNFIKAGQPVDVTVQKMFEKIDQKAFDKQCNQAPRPPPKTRRLTSAVPSKEVLPSKKSNNESNGYLRPTSFQRSKPLVQQSDGAPPEVQHRTLQSVSPLNESMLPRRKYLSHALPSALDEDSSNPAKSFNEQYFEKTEDFKRLLYENVSGTTNDKLEPPVPMPRKKILPGTKSTQLISITPTQDDVDQVLKNFDDILGDDNKVNQEYKKEKNMENGKNVDNSAEFSSGKKPNVKQLAELLSNAITGNARKYTAPKEPTVISPDPIDISKPEDDSTAKINDRKESKFVNVFGMGEQKTPSEIVAIKRQQSKPIPPPAINKPKLKTVDVSTSENTQDQKLHVSPTKIPARTGDTTQTTGNFIEHGAWAEAVEILQKKWDASSSESKTDKETANTAAPNEEERSSAPERESTNEVEKQKTETDHSKANKSEKGKKKHKSSKKTSSKKVELAESDKTLNNAKKKKHKKTEQSAKTEEVTKQKTPSRDLPKRESSVKVPDHSLVKERAQRPVSIAVIDTSPAALSRPDNMLLKTDKNYKTSDSEITPPPLEKTMLPDDLTFHERSDRFLGSDDGASTSANRPIESTSIAAKEKKLVTDNNLKDSVSQLQPANALSDNGRQPLVEKAAFRESCFEDNDVKEDSIGEFLVTDEEIKWRKNDCDVEDESDFLKTPKQTTISLSHVAVLKNKMANSSIKELDIIKETTKEQFVEETAEKQNSGPVGDPSVSQEKDSGKALNHSSSSDSAKNSEQNSLLSFKEAKPEVLCANVSPQSVINKKESEEKPKPMPRRRALQPQASDCSSSQVIF